MPLVRWEPFSSLRPFRNWPLWWDEELEERPSQGLSVYETKDDMIVEAAVPGIPEDKVEVIIEGDLITVRGEMEEKEEEEKKKTYYRKMEKRSFCYTSSLPRPVKADKATAEVKDGMVIVKVPKAEEVKPKTVRVKATGKKK